MFPGAMDRSSRPLEGVLQCVDAPRRETELKTKFLNLLIVASPIHFLFLVGNLFRTWCGGYTM
jgi:hypothetical protein